MGTQLVNEEIISEFPEIVCTLSTWQLTLYNMHEVLHIGIKS